MMRCLFAALLLAVSMQGVDAVTLTHYGAPDDNTGDSLSAAGIGNHNNQLVPLQSAALSADVAAANNIALGASFSVTADNGTTYNLIYADTAPEAGRVDIYDPNNVLGGANDFSAGVTNINNGPVLFGGGAVGAAGGIQNVNTPAIVAAILGKFQNAGQKWVGTLEAGARSLFWILATISFAWTAISAGLRRAEVGEWIADLVRFVFFTGLFYWLLINGPDFSGKIIASLWQMGGQASGSGNAIYPAQLINLGLQVFQGAMNHINFFEPGTIVAPVLIALIILIVCALVSVNMILLLCSAWVVLYAGIIFLSFGAIAVTRDMAIAYFRQVLGIGVSLMTMQLIIGLGTSFLQDLVAAVGQNPEVAQLATIMIASIILAVIAHQLPKMVASMATGGGYGGHVGHVGALSLLGAGFAGARLASVAAGAATGGVGSAVIMSATDKLRERIAGAAETMSGGNGNGASSYSRMESTVNSAVTPGSPPRPSYAPSAPPAPMSPTPPTTTTTMPVVMEDEAGAIAADDPVSENPVLPDESRGFEPPPDFVYTDEPL